MPARNAEKIYSLMYVWVLDNLNSIGQNGWQATTRLLRVYLFNVYFLALTQEALGLVCFGINSPRVIKCNTSQTI